MTSFTTAEKRLKNALAAFLWGRRGEGGSPERFSLTNNFASAFCEGERGEKRREMLLEPPLLCSPTSGAKEKKEEKTRCHETNNTED